MFDEGLDECGELGVGDGSRVFIFVGKAKCREIARRRYTIGLVKKIVGLLEFKMAEVDVGA